MDFFSILLFFLYVKQTTFWTAVCGQCTQESCCALVWFYFGTPQLKSAKKVVRQGTAAKGPRAPREGSAGAGWRGEIAIATSSCLKGWLQSWQSPQVLSTGKWHKEPNTSKWDWGWTLEKKIHWGYSASFKKRKKKSCEICILGSFWDLCLDINWLGLVLVMVPLWTADGTWWLPEALPANKAVSLWMNDFISTLMYDTCWSVSWFNSVEKLSDYLNEYSA